MTARPAVYTFNNLRVGSASRLPTPSNKGHGGNMNKSELVESLANSKALTYKKSEEIVNLIFDSMAETLSSGGRIEIRGFGSFVVKDYKAYTGRNPKTGEVIEVKPKRLPFFKVGKELREKVNN